MSGPVSSAVALANERAAGATPVGEDWRPTVRTLASVLTDPSVTAEPDYVAPPFVEAGEVALLAAPPKAGKSTLVSQEAAALSMGGVGLDGESLRQGRVVWIAYDEPLRRLAPRLEALGAHPDDFRIIVREPGQVLRAPHLADLLAEHQPRLVVLDTTSQLATDSSCDPNDGQAVAAFLRPLVDVIREASSASPCAGIFIHHSPHHASRAAGSVQWAAVVDTVAVLRRRRRGVDLRTDEPGDDGEADDTGDDGERILEGVGRAAGPFKMRLQFTAGRYSLAETPPPLIERLRTLLTSLDCAPGVSSGAKLRERLRCQSAALYSALDELESRGEVKAIGAAKSRNRHYVTTASLRLYLPSDDAQATPHHLPGSSSEGSPRSDTGKMMDHPSPESGKGMVEGGNMTEDDREEAKPGGDSSSSRVHGYTPTSGKMMMARDGELPLDSAPEIAAEPWSAAI